MSLYTGPDMHMWLGHPEFYASCPTLFDEQALEVCSATHYTVCLCGVILELERCSADLEMNLMSFTRRIGELTNVVLPDAS